MNSKMALLFVFVLCTLQSISFAASISDKLLMILGTENETVENVQLILKSGDRFSHNLLETISKCKNLDVARVIYFAVYHAHNEAATGSAIKNTISKIFTDFDSKVEEGSLAHKLIDLCLQQLAILRGFRWFRSDWPGFYEPITVVITASLLQGNFEMVHSFLAAKCAFPSVPVASVKESAKPLEALKLCVKNSKYSKQGFAFAFFEIDQFSPDMFKALISEKILNHNYCMDAAMKNGRLDLAYVGYKHGLQFDVYPNGIGYNEVEFLIKRTAVSEYIAVKESFPKVKLLLEALNNPESKLFYIPRDILVKEICSRMFNITIQKILGKLFKHHERSYSEEDEFYCLSSEYSDYSDSD